MPETSDAELPPRLSPGAHHTKDTTGGKEGFDIEIQETQCNQERSTYEDVGDLNEEGYPAAS